MIERFRPRAALPEIEPEPAPKEAKKVWTRLRLNRNFLNYPLARSARTRASWRKENGVWWRDLPGENRIELSVPAEARTALRRCPTGFDMNVLFVLLAAVQGADDPKRFSVERVEIPSLAVVLRTLHLTAHSENRTRVLDSLELWSLLSIYYTHWYDQGEHVIRDFSPPIESVDFHGQSVNVTLNSQWVQLALAKKYYAALPFPLPHEASVQNFVLMLLTSMAKQVEEKFEFSYSRSRRLFCRKIGLRCESGKLERIADLAEKWFAARNGSLTLLGEGYNKSGDVAFMFKPPQIPRKSWSPVEGATQI
jgi:hypothetical protein